MWFIEAFAAADGDRLAPLVADRLTSSPLHKQHQHRIRQGRVHALGVWDVRDLTVTGFQSHLYADGERLRDPSVEASYVAAVIEQGKVDPLAAAHLPEQVIESPAVVFVSWGREIYGHVLVEMAPKIAIAAKALGCAAEDLSFLIPADAPEWFRHVILRAGARRFVEYDSYTHNALLRRAYVVTLPWNMSLHPACRDLFAAMRPRDAGPATDLLYLTRRQASVTRPIRMRNAAEIEGIAARAGLRVVAPEQMSVAEQARLFAQARLVVGEYGSAMMNAVFCRLGAVVAAIGTRSGLLSSISAACNLRAAFMTPLGDVEDAEGYSVDPDAFARWLEALIEAANSAGAEQLGHDAAQLDRAQV